MIDTAAMFDESARLTASAALNPVPIASGMSRWFDYCDAVAPTRKELWKRLRLLDFEADARRLSEWLAQLLSAEPPPKDVNGLWFGLHNPCDAEGEASCQMYIGGSTGFDPKTKFNEWVCDLSYFPEGWYATSQVLPEIYRLVDSIEEENVSYLGEAFLAHGFLALLVSNWCHGPMKSHLLGNAEMRAVVIGHDNGDFYRLSVLRRDHS